MIPHLQSYQYTEIIVHQYAFCAIHRMQSLGYVLCPMGFPYHGLIPLYNGSSGINLLIIESKLFHAF